MADLLSQLFDCWVLQDKVPDEMSMEFAGRYRERPLIYFRWFDTNKEKEFGYTDARYNEVWRKFNDFWRSDEGMSLRKVREFGC